MWWSNIKDSFIEEERVESLALFQYIYYFMQFYILILTWASDYFRRVKKPSFARVTDLKEKRSKLPFWKLTCYRINSGAVLSRHTSSPVIMSEGWSLPLVGTWSDICLTYGSFLGGICNRPSIITFMFLLVAPTLAYEEGCESWTGKLSPYRS